MNKNENMLLNRKRWWDIPSIILLFVIITIAFNRLAVTKWTEHLNIVLVVASIGLIAGIALGQSVFSAKLAILLSLFYGSFVVPWQVGLELGGDITWLQRLYMIWIRMQIVVDHLVQRKPVPDNLLFIVLMCLLFWILSVHAGFTLIRIAEPWRIIIPTGIALVVIHSYDSYVSSRILYLVVYLFFALLLVARLFFLHNKYRWEQTQTYLPPHIGSDILQITITITVILLLLAWVIPARAQSIHSATEIWELMKEPFQGIRDYFDNAFASLKSSMGIVNDYYGPTLVLGRGNRLSENEVFTVLAQKNPPEGTRYYWRARVYDTYSAGKWNSSLNSERTVKLGASTMRFNQYDKRATGLYLFTFTSAQTTSTIYAASQPERVSIEAKAIYSDNPDGTIDLEALRAISVLHSGDTYSERSSLSGATIKTMQQAGTEYPIWISTRYLQLPTSITPRIQRLARDITDGLKTPYEKVVAITDYLRTNIKYSETISELPNNQEPVDWFLFDYKKGFCNYYATAEVILLRSIGIPARIAVGYAQGEPLEFAGVFKVRQRDAHAWPEVYFQDLGWVEFEPTTSQPTIIRPSGESQPIDSSLGIVNSRKLEEQNDRQRPNPPANLPKEDQIPSFRIILSEVCVLLIIGMAVFFIKNSQIIQNIPPTPVILENALRRIGIQPPRRLSRWVQESRLPKVARAYLEINFALNRLGKPPNASKSPGERADSLIHLIPKAEKPVLSLLNEYHRFSYSLLPANQDIAEKSGKAIRTLSYHKLFKHLISKIQLVK